MRCLRACLPGQFLERRLGPDCEPSGPCSRSEQLCVQPLHCDEVNAWEVPCSFAEAGIGSGDVRLVRADVPPMLEGSPIRELTAIGEISIVAVSHDNETFVPTQGTVLDHGDIIYAAVQATSASKFRAMLGMTD